MYMVAITNVNSFYINFNKKQCFNHMVTFLLRKPCHLSGKIKSYYLTFQVGNKEKPQNATYQLELT